MEFPSEWSQKSCWALSSSFTLLILDTDWHSWERKKKKKKSIFLNKTFFCSNWHHRHSNELMKGDNFKFCGVVRHDSLIVIMIHAPIKLQLHFTASALAIICIILFSICSLQKINVLALITAFSLYSLFGFDLLHWLKPVLNWANVCSPENTSDTLTNYDSFLNWTFSSPNMVRTVQTLLHSQLACNEMQASARTCGRRTADSMIENVG